MHKTAFRRNLFGCFFTAILLALPAGAASLEPAKMVELLKGIDQRIRSSGDYKALVYLEQREKDRPDIVREALAYRRDADEKLMILFTKPKTEAGKGYLRIDKNLWYYDPTVGKWERRTDRERIAGTDSRRQDFDQSKLAEEYTPSFEKEEKLGNFAVLGFETYRQTEHRRRLSRGQALDRSGHR